MYNGGEEEEEGLCPGVARVEDRKKEKNERDDSTVNGKASKCPIRVRERVTRDTSLELVIPSSLI